MTYLLNEPWLFGLVLAISLAATIELGRRTAADLQISDDTNRKDQMVAIRDGLFLLASLLLGFTMALAVPRYTERRALLVEEAISIGTTYLRAGMLRQPYRDNSRELRQPQCVSIRRLESHLCYEGLLVGRCCETAYCTSSR
ncbi:MAG: hypothetical protein WAK48_24385 [Candidatus Acidiferrum sp.]|jgi:hypothetical protein